jgi:mannose-1-phosphate guanylyltransferase
VNSLQMRKNGRTQTTSQQLSEETFAAGPQAGAIPMLPVAPHGRASATRRDRWGVILAGGDGTRLQRLTRLICGDDRPKQFCALVGNDTLLEQTRKRAERSIPWEQILFPLTRSHRAFYLQEPGIRPSQRIVQPANKGTAPPILHSLLSIERNDKEAIVAILPCDHHYSDEQMFTVALESAFDIAAQRTGGSVVLLGAHPERPEVEYGWIELGPSAGGAAFHVRGFCEKPATRVARELLERGSLWNTFVMVGHVRSFLEIVNAALTGLVDVFRRNELWAGAEVHIEDSLYERIHSVNFSREVLSVQTKRLVALRLGHTRWNDLGHPERVMAVLQATGLEPWWMKEWQAPRRPPAVAAPLTKPAVG